MPKTSFIIFKFEISRSELQLEQKENPHLELKGNVVEEHIEMVPNSVSNKLEEKWVEILWEEL